MGWSSVIQGIFDIGAQGLQIAHDRATQQRSYLYNEMAANNADARTRALYASFETPTAKKEMLEKAGFNPALVYSGMNGSIPNGAQGAGGSGSANNLGRVEAPNLGYIYELLNLKKDLDIKNSTKKNIDADTENKEADTTKKTTEVGKIKSEIDLMRKQGKLTDAQADKVNKEIDMMDTQIDEIVSRINLNRKQEDKLDAEIAKTNFETNFLLPSIKALNDFQSGKTEVEVFGQKYNSKEIELLMHNTYLQLYHFIATMLGADNIRDIKGTVDKVWGKLKDTWVELFGEKEMPNELKDWMDRNKYGKDPFSWQDK